MNILINIRGVHLALGHIGRELLVFCVCIKHWVVVMLEGGGGGGRNVLTERGKVSLIAR